jgi:hypothetical protein
MCLLIFLHAERYWIGSIILSTIHVCSYAINEKCGGKRALIIRMGRRGHNKVYPDIH